MDKSRQETMANESINILESLYDELVKIDMEKEDVTTQMDNIKLDTESMIAETETRVSYIPKLVKQALADNAQYQTLYSRQRQLIYDAKRKENEISIAKLRSWMYVNLCN